VNSADCRNSGLSDVRQARNRRVCKQSSHKVGTRSNRRRLNARVLSASTFASTAAGLLRNIALLFDEVIFGQVLTGLVGRASGDLVLPLLRAIALVASPSIVSPRSMQIYVGGERPLFLIPSPQWMCRPPRSLSLRAALSVGSPIIFGTVGLSTGSSTTRVRQMTSSGGVPAASS
jgi:hypothetical protein